jgi:chromate transporter
MAVKLCPDRERLTLAIVVACVVLGSSIPWLQVVVIAVCALFGWIFLRDKHWLQLADAFYRSGALVFGGGHVVLPLLQSETVLITMIVVESCEFYYIKSFP